MASNNKNLLKTLLTVNAGCGCGSPKLSDVYEPKPKPKPKSKASNPKLCSSSSSYYRNNGLSLSAMEETNDLTSTSFSFNNIIDTTISSTTDLNSESEPEPEPDLPTSRSSKVLLSSSPCTKFIDRHSSITVVTDSNDPYQDFRHSMLQMIMEKQIYSKDDLQELLQCFLELNSPFHHDVIVRAFMEIWNQVVPKKTVTVLEDERQHSCFVHGKKHES